MNKKCYRYFGNLIKAQENWLNRMAAKGWRLAQTGKLYYEFEPCEPGAWEYQVEFVGHLSWKKNKEYRGFLEETGYEVFHKNVNLNCSLVKIRGRPYGVGLGQISTSPGSYNKELLLVGRPADGKPFSLHTTLEDMIRYTGVLRKSWLMTAIAFLSLGGWSYFTGGLQAGTALSGAAGAFALVQTALYHRQMMVYREEAKTRE